MNRVLKTKEAVITNRYSDTHKAVDLVGKGHTVDDVVAHCDGVIVFVQTGKKNHRGSFGNESYGNFVKIKHEGDYYTLYAHLDKVYVKKNEKIKKGQLIGTMGDSGNAYGKHLHFEVWKGQNRINPTKYLTEGFSNFVYPIYKGKNNSLVDALKSLKIDSSFSNREKIAHKNGILDYKGTATQNIKLLTLLKQGKLKK